MSGSRRKRAEPSRALRESFSGPPLSSRDGRVADEARCDPARSSLHGQSRRWIRFNAIGAMGVIVHTASLLAGARLIHLNYLAATAVAVEAAVIHNFVWHLRWTWADRRSNERRLPGRRARARDLASMFLGFNASTGAVSLFGNLAMMRLLAGAGRVGLAAATLISICCCSLLNFLIADRLIFRKRCRAGRS